MDATEHKTLELADRLQQDFNSEYINWDNVIESSAELRRLSAENEALRLRLMTAERGTEDAAKAEVMYRDAERLLTSDERTLNDEVLRLRAQVEALTATMRQIADAQEENEYHAVCNFETLQGMAKSALIGHPTPSPLTRPAVPEGWKLVPKEPTVGMGWAYLDAARLYAADGSENEMRFSWGGYRAMLAAAPQPEAVQKDNVQ